MEELLYRLSHDVSAIVFLALAFLAGMTVWHMLQSRLRRTEIEAALKQDMLNRGMSADEIERVLRAPLNGSYDSVDQLLTPSWQGPGSTAASATELAAR